MRDKSAENLWQELQAVFERTVVFVGSLDRNLKHTIGRSSNEAFPMRAYLSVMKSGTGEEIAIAVDVKASNGFLVIESDISCDDGSIVAEGPTAVLKKVVAVNLSETEIMNWIGAFEQFLTDNQEVLKAKLLQLS